MLIDGMVNQLNQNFNIGNKRGTTTNSQATERQSAPVNTSGTQSSSVAALEKGQLFEGTVSGIKGDKVSLSLSNGETVQARLAEDVALTKGESVFFEVKSNDGAMVQIRPVSMGALNNPALLQALDMANLPTNEKNVNMVNLMMGEQLPIDGKSLGEMARNAAMHPDVEMDTLVTMQKAGIPITDEMIEQFQNYKMGENAIMDSILNLTDSMAEAFSSPNVGNRDVSAFVQNLTNILTAPEGEAAPLVDGLGNWSLPEGVVLPEEGMSDLFAAAMEEFGMDADMELTADGQVLGGAGASVGQQAVESETGIPPFPEKNENGALAGTGALNEQDVLSASVDSSEGSEAADEGVQGRLSAQVTPEVAETAETASEEVSTLRQEIEIIADEIPGKEESKLPQNSLGRVMSGSDLSSLAKELKSMGFDLSKVVDEKGQIKPDTKATDLMKLVSSQLSDRGDLSKSDLINMMKSDNFKKLIGSAMREKWTLTPEQVADKANIKKLFAGVSNDMERLSQAAGMAAKGENAISSAADQIRSNIDFVNHLNEAFSYVQLPLKMSGQSATGDMYVFTNKKNRFAPGDEVSAFLHFDLDHLGSTDISVKMQDKKVKTKFFMDDPASFDLIEKNLPLLQKKLEELGYNCKLAVENEDNPIDFVEDFLKQDAPAKSNKISRYSFDMKA